MNSLQQLEAEAIYILREVAGQFSNPALLFSGGKDSVVVLHLAKKAFYPGAIPLTLLHVDTGHNFPETLTFRDETVRKYGTRMVISEVESYIKKGVVKEDKGRFASRNRAQIPVLLSAIQENGFDACVGGARRDEDKARAKERIFSLRDSFGQWNASAQRPEFFHHYNGRVSSGGHIRVFPISNWTELDVWRYIKQESLALPSLYFSHRRRVIHRGGLLWPESPWTSRQQDDKVEECTVRFRTVGDMSCTAAIPSQASDIDAVIDEIMCSRQAERGGRIDDLRSQASMEERKRYGYF